MIDDAAALLGERHHRAHALDIGGKPAIERLRRLADQLAGLLDRLGEIDLLAGDLEGSTAAARVRTLRSICRSRSSIP